MSHPVAFALERLVVDDLPAAESDAVRAHVRQCEKCRAYVDSLRTMSATRLAQVPPALFVARLAAQRRGGRRRWLAAATATGALVAASLLMLAGRPTLRMKGGGFALERQRDGVVTRLASEARVRAGDRLRVIVTQPVAGPVAVWFVDVRGRVDALLDAPMTLPAGESALPGSVTIESPCVDGWVVVARGDGTSPSAEAILRVRAAGGAAASEPVPPGVPDGARVASLRCE